MPHFKCYPITDPNANWNYCPSYTAAILFATLFGLTAVSHTLQAVLHKKPFAIVITIGAIWEFAGYIFRILSVENQLTSGLALAQLLLILLAPLWINAFVYMVLGRMIHFYLADDRVFGIKARRVTLLFVLCDITAFIVQASGGSMTSNSEPVHIQEIGLHIYMGGVGLQLLFICIFLLLSVRFQHKLKQQEASKMREGAGASFTGDKSPVVARRLLCIIYAVLLLIVFRNIYRLIEFSSGVVSNITTHEWYAYVFDAVPMLFALLVFNAFHPGRFLRGENSDFSEENRARKAEKKEKKIAKRLAKDNAKREKLQVKPAK